MAREAHASLWFTVVRCLCGVVIARLPSIPVCSGRGYNRGVYLLQEEKKKKKKIEQKKILNKNLLSWKS